MLLAKTEADYLEGRIDTFDSLKDKLKLVTDQPAERQDPLDRFRIIATLLMVAALFTIVVVIVNKKNPPTTLFQFVSLASGLAGIGLGWLFGTGAVRRK